MTDLPEPDERTPNCAICLARGRLALATRPREFSPAFLYCAECFGEVELAPRDWVVSDALAALTVAVH